MSPAGCVGSRAVNLCPGSGLELVFPALTTLTTRLLGNLGQTTWLFCGIFPLGGTGLPRFPSCEASAECSISPYLLSALEEGFSMWCPWYTCWWKTEMRFLEHCAFDFRAFFPVLLQYLVVS